jgi:hypothetical protein
LLQKFRMREAAMLELGLQEELPVGLELQRAKLDRKSNS